MSIEIRRATVDDLAAIAKIQAESHRASAWEPSSYLDHDCRVALANEGAGDRVVGFIVTREVAPPQAGSRVIEGAEREILDLAVDPANRRQGIGRALVEAEIASAPGVVWFLEVRESNVEAINLYKAAGFSAAGRRAGYYSNPIEAAIVMRFFS